MAAGLAVVNPDSPLGMYRPLSLRMADPLAGNFKKVGIQMFGIQISIVIVNVKIKYFRLSSPGLFLAFPTVSNAPLNVLVFSISPEMRSS